MSAYGNPQPYPDPELERSALLGRLTVARSCARSEDPRVAARWRLIVDELLDHLSHVADRAASAALDKAS